MIINFKYFCFVLTLNPILGLNAQVNLILFQKTVNMYPSINGKKKILQKCAKFIQDTEKS